MLLIFLRRPAGRPWYILMLRGRKIWKTVLLNDLIRWLSGSDVIHVLTSDGEVAMDPARKGDRFWPQEAVRYMPFYWRSIWLDAGRCLPIDFDRVARKRRSAWRSLACWMTAGWIRSHDCVQVARECLATRGIVVPRSVTTPIALYEFALMMSQGPRSGRLGRRI